MKHKAMTHRQDAGQRMRLSQLPIFTYSPTITETNQNLFKPKSVVMCVCSDV